MPDNSQIVSRSVLSRGFGVLEEIVFRRRRRDGMPVELKRQILDAGDGATILPYDASRGTVILIRQFRGVAFLAQGVEGMIEACAGKLDGADPLTRIVKETEEETGIRIVGQPTRLFEAYSSPGSLTERLTYFVVPYTPKDRVSAGGGLESEEEDIEVLEITLDEGLAMVESGAIVDAKTIVLLYYARFANLMGG